MEEEDGEDDVRIQVDGEEQREVSTITRTPATNRTQATADTIAEGIVEKDCTRGIAAIEGETVQDLYRWHPSRQHTPKRSRTITVLDGQTSEREDDTIASLDQARAGAAVSNTIIIGNLIITLETVIPVQDRITIIIVIIEIICTIGQTGTRLAQVW